jgi:hypothetical protein
MGQGKSRQSIVWDKASQGKAWYGTRQVKAKHGMGQGKARLEMFFFLSIFSKLKL